MELAKRSGVGGWGYPWVYMFPSGWAILAKPVLKYHLVSKLPDMDTQQLTPLSFPAMEA